MNKKELRIGNIINKGVVVNFYEHGVIVENEERFTFDEIEPVDITKDFLDGSEFIERYSEYNVGNVEHILNLESTDNNSSTPNRDGTWMASVGTYSFRRNKEMVVLVLCRGNYVCNNISTVHELQNTFYFLSGREFKTKTNNDTTK